MCCSATPHRTDFAKPTFNLKFITISPPAPNFCVDYESVYILCYFKLPTLCAGPSNASSETRTGRHRHGRCRSHRASIAAIEAIGATSSITITIDSTITAATNSATACCCHCGRYSAELAPRSQRAHYRARDNAEPCTRPVLAKHRTIGCAFTAAGLSA